MKNLCKREKNKGQACPFCFSQSGVFQLFEHKCFEVYDFKDIPLNMDCFLMNEIYIEEYEKSFLEFITGGQYKSVGYISYVSVRNINENSLEISWYPNIHDRFHEVTITLPKEELIICIDCWEHDEKPHLFVKSWWLENLYTRYYSIFGLIDAIGVKDALQNGKLSKQKLISLRDAIDNLAMNYPDISFISFADSILVKSN
jgi:hypothetical protein